MTKYFVFKQADGFSQSIYLFSTDLFASQVQFLDHCLEAGGVFTS
jgi:hypothetical protein